MRILVVGDCERSYLAKYHEAFRNGLRQTFDTRFFGEGYENYRPELRDYRDIIAHTFPDAAPDIMIVAVDHLTNTPGFMYAVPFDGLESVTVPKCIVWSDFWNVTEGYQSEYLEFLDRYRINAVLCYYPRPLQVFAHTSHANRFVFLPPCVEFTLFNDWGCNKEFDVGFLGAGIVSPDPFYPERAALHSRLKTIRNINYLTKPHPGWGNHDPSHPTVGEGFSRLINSCRIFITSGGRYNCPYPKFVEALASKALLLAIEPEGAAELGLRTGENYVTITPENVIETVERFLANHEEREAIAERGYQLALDRHSSAARAADFYRIAKKIIANHQSGLLGVSAPSMAAQNTSVQLASFHALELESSPTGHAPIDLARYGNAVRLHLGCGQDYMQGWVNVDRDPNATADVRVEFLQLDQVLPPNSVIEVRMIHSLNYLTLWEARAFFRMLRRLCKPGAKIAIETVDAEKSMARALENRGKFNDYLEGIRALHGFGLDHLESETRYTPNAFSWTPWHLAIELTEAGFENIRVCEPETHAKWRDMRFEFEAPSSAVYPRQLADARRSGRRVLIAFDPHLGHTTQRVRGTVHTEMFRKHGWNVRFLDIRSVSEEEVVEAARQADLTYLLKVSSYRLLRRLKQETTTKVVFDLTDALWRPPHQSEWPDLEAMLTECDAIFSENECVSSFGRRFNKVYSIPVITNSEDYDRLRPVVPARLDGKVRIGWVGSTGTMTALHAIRDALVPLFQNHENLELRIVGCADPSMLEPLRGIRFSVVERYDEEVMLREILQMDIGLFPPPVDVEDYCVRGALKAFLYMQAGVPPVCLNAGEPAREIEDGVTGMLCSSLEDWTRRIEELIRSPELRREMGRRAAEKVRHGHEHEYVFQCLQAALIDVIESPGRPQVPVVATSAFVHSGQPLR